MRGLSLGELKARVRARLSESEEQFFTENDLRRYLNEAQDAVITDCPWVLRSNFRMVSVPACSSYVVPNDLISPMGVWFKTPGGQIYRVDYIEPGIMDQKKQNILQDRSTRILYVTYRTERYGTYAEFYPTPSDYMEFVVEGSRRPYAMVNDLDESDIPPHFSHVLVNYALWKCKTKDEETDDAKEAHAIFEKELNDMRARRTMVHNDQKVRTRLTRRMGWGRFF